MRRRIVAAAMAAVVALLMAPASAAPSALDLSALRLPAHYGFAASHGAFLLLHPGVEHAAALRRIRAAGVVIGVDAPAADAVWVTGDAAALGRAAALPEVARLAANRQIDLASETSVWATGARQTHEPTGGRDIRLRDADGTVIDGSGVGIAIVDTGIDATHPDLRWAGFGDADPKVIRNFHLFGSLASAANQGLPPHQYADAAHTDTMGHGTHVAGIAAGTGGASGGRYRGVAPGAKLYGFAPGRGYPFLGSDVVAALQWIYDHGHEQDPPIRVINGSFGAGGPHLADDPSNKLVEALVRDRGITMVWAAMNGGGDGSADTTNQSGKTPTPGVLMVANYAEGDATRDGTLHETSSRGLATDPQTWPDLSAPGSGITAPCTPTGWMCAVGPASPWGRYASASGTSMAAPHATGVVALLYQAKPEITPAEVEHLLEATAHKFTFGAPYEADPLHPGTTSSFDKGHGLIDAYAAVTALVGGPGGLPAGRSTVLAADGEDTNTPDALDIRSLEMVENGDGTITLRLAVDGFDDPAAASTYRVGYVTPGRRVELTFAVDSQDVTATGPPTVDLARDGDAIVATYEATALGLAPGSIVLDAFAESLGIRGGDTAPPGRELAATGEHHASEEHVILGPAAGQ